MLELTGLGAIMTIFILMGIAGVASFGVVEILRRGYLAWSQAHGNKKSPWWWNPALRVLAVLVGTGAGFALMHTVVGAGLGLAAGALNTTMVAVVKAKLKSLAPSAEE